MRKDEGGGNDVSLLFLVLSGCLVVWLSGCLVVWLSGCCVPVPSSFLLLLLLPSSFLPSSPSLRPWRQRPRNGHRRHQRRPHHGQSPRRDRPPRLVQHPQPRLQCGHRHRHGHPSKSGVRESFRFCFFVCLCFCFCRFFVFLFCCFVVLLFCCFCCFFGPIYRPVD